MLLAAGWRRLLENHLLVHIEHLLAILAKAEEPRGDKGSEDDGLPRVGKRPVLHLWKIVGEPQEAEKVCDEYQPGMALESRVGTGEGNFAKADKDSFDEEHCAGGQDRSVKQS